MSLDTTVGGENSNSYISVADADSYFDARVGTVTTWTDATTANKEKALKHATREIDTLNYPGTLYYQDEQALKFPRNAADSDRDAFGGVWDLDADGAVIIPKNVEYATCECALWLMKTDGEESIAQAMQRGMKDLSEGRLKYSGIQNDISSVIGPEAAKYLRKYVAYSAKWRSPSRRFPDYSRKWEGW